MRGDRIDPFAGMRGFLGVQLGDDAENERCIIQDVVPGTPADKAGVKPGDILLKLGPLEIKSAANVMEAMPNNPPGKPLTLLVRREGKERTIELKPAAVPFELLN
jgi:S1-C subfamily serine protease